MCFSLEFWNEMKLTTRVVSSELENNYGNSGKNDQQKSTQRETASLAAMATTVRTAGIHGKLFVVRYSVDLVRKNLKRNFRYYVTNKSRQRSGP